MANLDSLKAVTRMLFSKPCPKCKHPGGDHGPLLSPGSCLSCRIGEGCGPTDWERLWGKPLSYHPPKPEEDKNGE